MDTSGYRYGGDARFHEAVNCPCIVEECGYGKFCWYNLTNCRVMESHNDARHLQEGRAEGDSLDSGTDVTAIV